MNTNKLGMNITNIVGTIHMALGIILALAGVLYRVLCFGASGAESEFFRNFISGGAAAEMAKTVEFSVYSMQVKLPVTGGLIDPNLFLIFTLGGAVMLALMGRIFFNLRDIFKISSETSPFNEKNVEKIKQVGFLSIGVTAAGMICNFIMVVFSLLSGVGGVDAVTDITCVFWGIIVLCISRFFVYGTQLEKEVDGLL